MNYSQKLHGILWMILACFSLAVFAVITKYLTQTVNLYLVSAFHCFIALPLLTPWLIRKKVWFPKTSKLGLFSLRTIVGMSTLILWALGITMIPLAHVTTINFTAPLFTVILAVIFLSEKSSLRNNIALIIGFIGAIIIIRPFTETFHYGSLFVLFSALARAIVSTMIKKLSQTESNESIIFYTSFLMAVFYIPVAIYFWQPLNTEEILWLAVLAFVSNVYLFALTNAYSKTDLVILMPFDFTSLVFVSVISYFTFGETLDFWTVIGAIVILASAVYITRNIKH